MENNENEVGVSISNQLNLVKSVVNDWALQRQGICIIAESERDQLLPGFNNCLGPKCLVYFLGEDAYGPEETIEVTAAVIRHFEVIIQRGKLLGEPRNSQLTMPNGPVKAFFELAEELRDVVRCIIWPTPMVLNPGIYRSMKAGGVNEKNLIDSYVISFSTIVQIGRIQVVPPQLGNGPYVDLQDPLGLLDNQGLT